MGIYRHLGPIRAVPDFISIAQRSPSQDRWIDGMAAWDLLNIDAQLRINLDDLLRRDSRTHLALTDLRRNVSVNPSNIGAGVSQVQTSAPKKT